MMITACGEESPRAHKKQPRRAGEGRRWLSFFKKGQCIQTNTTGKRVDRALKRLSCREHQGSRVRVPWLAKKTKRKNSSAVLETEQKRTMV